VRPTRSFRWTASAPGQRSDRAVRARDRGALTHGSCRPGHALRGGPCRRKVRRRPSSVSAAPASAARERGLRDNGSIVDFVRHRTRDGIGRVRADLRRWLGVSRPDPGPDRRPPCPPVVRDRRAVVETFATARPLRNSAYLNSRGIRPDTLQSHRFRGTWRLDARGDVLFPHRGEDGLCGFEAKNRGFSGFASGGAKAIWESARLPIDTIVLIAESAGFG
jgi:hypothetical protein